MANSATVMLDNIEISNAAKTLYANIRFLSPDNPVRALSVTSSVPNEGKTTVSIELAKTIAASGRTVLLVEADMHRRSLAGALGVHPLHGLYSVMVEEVSIDDAVAPTGFENLSFLDVESSIPSPADVIASRSFADLVVELRSRFDYVIFDTPPVGVFIDAAILSTLTDGTIFVVRRNATKREEMEKAFQQLKTAGGEVLGVVMTFTEMTSNSYYSSRYYASDEKESEVPAPVRSAAPIKKPMPAKRTAVPSKSRTSARQVQTDSLPRVVLDENARKGRHHA